MERLKEASLVTQGKARSTVSHGNGHPLGQGFLPHHSLLVSLKKVECGIMEREAGIRKGDWKEERARVKKEGTGKGREAAT